MTTNLSPLLVFVLFFNLFAPATAESAEAEGTNPASPSKVLTGDCLAAQDPLKMEAPSFPSVCVRGAAFGEILTGMNSAAENFWLFGARGYAGVHLANWLSLHGSGEGLRAENSKTGRTEVLSRETDYVTANIGNVALHRWRLALGKPLLPFGVGDSPVMDSLQLLGVRGFWEGLEGGAVVTFDNMRDVQVEAGGFSTTPRNNDRYKKRIGNDAASARMSYDLPALDGSRLVFSFYGDRLEERRVGFAFINVSVKGDVTHFEFVRRYYFSKDNPADLEQLLRLAYLGAQRGTSRWAAQYDDVRRRHRLGVLGQDFVLGEQLFGRLGLAYRKGEAIGVESRWFVTGGVKWVL